MTVRSINAKLAVFFVSRAKIKLKTTAEVTGCQLGGRCSFCGFAVWAEGVRILSTPYIRPKIVALINSIPKGGSVSMPPLEGVSDLLTLSKGVFVFSTPLLMAEWSLVLRLPLEQLLDLGFLVADLLLLGEDGVGGDDGHEEYYHEGEGEEPGGEDVVTADEETGVARGERVDVEGTAVVGAECLALSGDLFEVGVEVFVAGFEVLESLKHGVVLDAKVVVVVSAEVGQLLALFLQKFHEFWTDGREIIGHDAADFFDAKLADGFVAV